jgi:phosphohistidine phosphatase
MADRRLVLVRHAEAANAPLDRDRPLSPRGEQQADAVGSWLAQAGLVPDAVLISPARRTQQTWERIRAALEAAPEPDLDERLYENVLDVVLEAVRETADDVRTLVLVGHNPSVLDLVLALDDSAAAREKLGSGFSPASVAVFDVPGPFAELHEGGATLVEVVRGR